MAAYMRTHQTFSIDTHAYLARFEDRSKKTPKSFLSSVRPRFEAPFFKPEIRRAAFVMCGAHERQVRPSMAPILCQSSIDYNAPDISSELRHTIALH